MRPLLAVVGANCVKSEKPRFVLSVHTYNTHVAAAAAAPDHQRFDRCNHLYQRLGSLRCAADVFAGASVGQSYDFDK